MLIDRKRNFHVEVAQGRQLLEAILVIDMTVESHVGDTAAEEVAMAVMSTTAIATAGLRLQCTHPTGTQGTTLHTGTQGTTPPTGMLEITTTEGEAGDTPHIDLLLMAVAGPGGSDLDHCRILPTGCLREAMDAKPVVVAMTGKVAPLALVALDT
uniref:Uncharacterized protein n=1 Tax=Oryza sativa subsp. japonica TaxID=39947 RepID=Q5Z989_ORYSJ|nr:unknown protein [Oryza sativa Japonica Group]BAD62535.1 unknown protein [Oryza sativa Japonica Group]